ncbi:porin [Parapedobacter koreensis]|uniref:Putative beta-barrel porin-2, OmpL-like. bbp2 n=1 Tax=Parapedobacter koreensis TaxID=332977 RepID=A0A1H7MHC9_9SPHI|nr:porin [Parapedobacter koreensis]SEL10308.1 Putative beta-barrel porin-2, OmpL-like. bbp2 [Parapedobacter koreensis]
MNKTLLATCLGFSAVTSVYAQTGDVSNPLTISGYIETYYVYDFGNPGDHNRPGFLYSYNRHNEVNLNFGFAQAAYDNGAVRGKLALMAGTYANANLAAEPGVLKNVYEANAGVKISKSKNLWVDAGIFASHIGFESAIGANCWNMTRSILAENSPYYLSGAKVSYTSDNGEWFLSGLVTNGWQRIHRVDGNNMPGFGHQLTWMPNEKVTLNSSSFVGSDDPDSTRRMRYFHNLHGQFQFNDQWGLIAGFDMGMQQQAKGSSDYHTWYSPVLIARYAPTGSLAFAARAEYYMDKSQVIIATDTPNGFQTFGYSLNMDVKVLDNVLWRLEGRSFNSREDRVFTDSDGLPIKTNFFLGTSLSISF